MASGDEIFVRTISKAAVVDTHGHAWNYHSRSDHHSKVACWGIVFDLLRASKVFRDHVGAGRVAFGINHEMRDFRNDRKKNLDLVICQPAGGAARGKRSLQTLANHYGVELTDAERAELTGLPALHDAPVGNVLIALEAKACMTAHQKALPRLYDELNSSHLTVHGAHDLAIAAGFVAINAAPRFLSPGLNNPFDPSRLRWNNHDQPKAVSITVEKVKQLPRRSKTGVDGYDALAIVVVDCANDGSPVDLSSSPPAPQPRDTYHYTSMIDRLRGLYDTRFAQL
jgi:hypothetical protein